jgi:hypothetical protein
MSLLSLDLQAKKVKLEAMDIEHPLVFSYFEQLPEARRDEAFRRALHIGVVAMMEDRIATFLSRTENELGTHLESLKLIYQRTVTAKEKTTQSGIDAEQVIYQKVKDYLKASKYDNDDLQLTGSNAGKLKKNKTGDLVLKVDGDETLQLAIEVKFDQGMALGEFEESDSVSRPRDTAISQLIEASANRDAKLSVIVFDEGRSGDGLKNKVNGIKWIPEVGFVVIIDHERDNYTNLLVALDLMRSMIKKPMRIGDQSILEALLGRISQDLSAIQETQKLLQANNENLKKIAASIQKHVLLVGYTKTLIQSFIEEGEISKKVLLDLYTGSEIRDEFKAISKEVEVLFPSLLSAPTGLTERA